VSTVELRHIELRKRVVGKIPRWAPTASVFGTETRRRAVTGLLRHGTGGLATECIVEWGRRGNPEHGVAGTFGMMEVTSRRRRELLSRSCAEQISAGVFGDKGSQATGGSRAERVECEWIRQGL
jgi:hypothetical protein